MSLGVTERECDVLLVVIHLQALREEPLVSTLRWPGDDKAACGGGGSDKGQRATANGASRVRDHAQPDALCLCVHCEGCRIGWPK